MDEFSEAMDLPTIKRGAADAWDLPVMRPRRSAADAVREVRTAAKQMIAAKPKTLPRFMQHEESKGERLSREHAELAEQHGWVAEVTHPTDDEWIVTAKQDDCVARVAWKGNTVNYPLVTATFPTHEFWLKHTAQFRRQITLPKEERPAQPTPPVKRIPKRAAAMVMVDPGETTGVAVVVDDIQQGPKYNVSNLPFAKDDEDAVIIDQVKGRVLYWRNTLAERVDHAMLPSTIRTIRLTEHPRTGRRILSFPESHGWDAQTASEVLGAERSVALDQMIRLG